MYIGKCIEGLVDGDIAELQSVNLNKADTV
ncbi:hypothetical protein HALLA_01720 (plasmid) [Halostagnicola larsenii XH-48]|uniref:Uncharacterized protein n=1 Tax=Halostagnicola larsenii XH-48 TaxID=797299 RepID=W0JTW2_9EURY|nr:hypothetical protein HALLA_01720 [Halostagnicola larsenii XH-48]